MIDDLQKKYISKNKESLKTDERQIKEFYKYNNMKSGKRILPFYASPYFISKRQHKRIAKISNKISIILNKVAKEIFENFDVYKKLFKITPFEKELFNYSQGYEDINVLSRFDLFFDGNNVKLIEFNTESPSGIGRSIFIEEAFIQTKLFNRFKDKNKVIKNKDMREILLRAFVKKHREFLLSKKETSRISKKPTIALIDWDWISTKADQVYIADYFYSQGYNAFLCDPTSLRYRDNHLFYKKKAIDIVYKRALTNELVEKNKQCQDLFKAVKNRDVCMINSFASTLLGDKRLLNYIHEGKFNHILTTQEKNIIKETIPWSRTVLKDKIEDFSGEIVNSEEFLKNNKDKIVLKASIGYGGKEVFVGNQTKKIEWNKIINLSQKTKTWVAQEYVDIPKIKVANSRCKNLTSEKYINLCPYIIDNKVAGFLTRVSSSKVINISSGGGILPTFIVEE